MNDGIPPLRFIMVAHGTGEMPLELVSSLSQGGYKIVAAAPANDDVLRLVHSLKPQLVLMFIDRTSTAALDAIRQVTLLRIAGVVILMNEWDSTLAKEAMDRGIVGYMIKPFNASIVRSTLETSWHHFCTIQTLQESLELRKLVERAKGVLMEQRKISEEQAHQTLLRMSQDQGVPMKDLCHSIIQAKMSLMDHNRN